MGNEAREIVDSISDEAGTNLRGVADEGDSFDEYVRAIARNRDAAMNGCDAADGFYAKEDRNK